MCAHLHMTAVLQYVCRTSDFFCVTIERSMSSPEQRVYRKVCNEAMLRRPRRLFMIVCMWEGRACHNQICPKGRERKERPWSILQMSQGHGETRPSLIYWGDSYIRSCFLWQGQIKAIAVLVLITLDFFTTFGRAGERLFQFIWKALHQSSPSSLEGRPKNLL